MPEEIMAPAAGAVNEDIEAGDSGKLPPSAMVKPLSLPDNLLALTQQKEVNILARVLVVATHNGAQDEVVRQLESATQDRGTITGVGIVARQACMLLCEGESDAMRSVVLGLRAVRHESLSEVRVAAFCDDVPTRCFETFGVVAANVPKEANLEVPEDSMTKFIFEVYQKCTLLGKAIGSREARSAVLALVEKEAGLFVSSERLAAIAAHEDAMTLEDFYDLHGRPAQPESLGDIIWPMQDIAVDLLR